MADESLADRWAQVRSRVVKRQSVTVKPASTRLGRAALNAHLEDLGRDGPVARDLDSQVTAMMSSVTSLSPLTSPMALDYMDRLARPIPSLTPEIGVMVVGRAYVGHMAVEADPARYRATDVPVLGTLPPLRRGRPPQDLLSRVVKASRRSFQPLCALTPQAWDGFVWCLTKRCHDHTRKGEELVPTDVVDGVARFAWVLRQVDLHYGLQPETAP